MRATSSNPAPEEPRSRGPRQFSRAVGLRQERVAWVWMWCGRVGTCVPVGVRKGDRGVSMQGVGVLVGVREWECV